MEEHLFLKAIAEEIRKALNSGGYRNIEFFDENIVNMNGPSGENIDGESTVARMFKPVSDNDIIITLAYKEDDKYEIIVTLSDDVDFSEFNDNVGNFLKQLSGKWGNRLDYTLHTWGREIISRDDIKRQVQGAKEVDIMENQISEALVKMTGTTKTSYQKIGECKVIIRHTGRVNEEKHGSRSRNINAIFIETKSGERFKMAENNLHGARAMARHLSNSGSPFDSVGTKITTMMSEMAQLRKMVVESRSIGRKRALTEEQTDFTNQLKTRYIKLRETLKKMTGKFGYSKYFETLEEEQITELEYGRDKQWGQDPKALATVQPALDYYELLDRVKAKTVEYRKHSGSATEALKTAIKDVLSNAEREKMAVAMGSDDTLRQEYLDFQASLSPKTPGGDSDLNMAGYIMENKKNEMKVDTETKVKKEKKEDETVFFDQVPMYDRPTDGKAKLVRNADTLFSVNEKYGTAPEDKIIEEWFDGASNVEFFNEEELVIEDTTPTIKKTLPENALGMLNMYIGHPLFAHYMRLYENQEILDDVFSLVEEESNLWSSMTKSRKKLEEFANYGTDAMSMGRGEHPSEETMPISFDEALNKIQSLISDRRLNLENAINQVTEEIVGEKYDEETRNSVVDHLWGLAEESGLVKHDFGSTFSDQVLASNETIATHNDEIDAEEFYGDAKFSESNGFDMDTINHESKWANLYPGYWATLHELKDRGHGFDEIKAHAYEEFDNDMNPDDIKVMLNDFFELHGMDVSDNYGDAMDGDHESALASVYGDNSGDFDYLDEFEEMNRVRINAGLEPLIREAKDSCSCDCDDCGDGCNCPEDCDCKKIDEGDPFGRQSKRNLKNPKARMSLIHPKEKMFPSAIGEATPLGHPSDGYYDPAAIKAILDRKKPITKRAAHKKNDDMEEAKAIPDWVHNRERAMMNRLDRKQDTRKGGVRGDIEHDDKYSRMAKERGIGDKVQPTKKKVRGVRENENYVEVDMPHHLPKTEETHTGEPVLSEDGARIVELARYRQ